MNRAIRGQAGENFMKNQWTCFVRCLALAACLAVPAAQASTGPEATGHVSTGQKLANHLRAAGLSDDAIIVAISTLPIVELRGAIPVGHVLAADSSAGETPAPLSARLATSGRILFLAVLGNMIPVPLILWFLGPLSEWARRWPAGRRLIDWLFARTRKKSAEIEKYETLGLMIFVAIPLPATGAWTGAMAAFLMGLSFRHAMVSIFLGVVIAGLIMTVLSLLGWWGAAIAAVALLTMAAGWVAAAMKRKPPAA
jgi:uncharacterized membrane protein